MGALRWRLTTVLVFGAAGALFAVTSLSADGLDLRAASITDLNHVVRQEKDRSDELQDRLTALNAEVSRLSRQVSDREVTRLQGEVDQLREPAGFSAVEGPGLTVVLDDAPKSAIEKAREPGGITEDELVVHQQDIQAVVNALWAGGAEAMTLQDQRVVSTTGIKCVGNTVILHGRPYSPPYRIAAIGDPSRLEAALDNSDFVQAYLTFVIQYQLGYDVVPSVSLRFPAFTGTSGLNYARATQSTGTPGRD